MVVPKIQNFHNAQVICFGKIIDKLRIRGGIAVFNRKDFREFHSENEATEWAMQYFGSLITDMKSVKVEENKNSIADLLYYYTGGKNSAYNQYLRESIGSNELNEDEIEEYSKETKIIVNEICKFELQENIIVYRYTHKTLFSVLFESLNPKIGEKFVDKGFMSTTLIPDLLKKLAKDRRYNCILKLYLPKGTKGAYIKFDNSVLNEQEFLLPPNSTFKLKRKYFSFKYNTVYECELVSQ